MVGDTGCNRTEERIRQGTPRLGYIAQIIKVDGNKTDCMKWRGIVLGTNQS